MFKKAVAIQLMMSLVVGNTAVFAAGDDEKKVVEKQKITVQGKNGPETREITISELTEKARVTGKKRYAAVDFVAELGFTGKVPVLAKQLGVLIDEAIEMEDAATLVSLSLSLAALESASPNRRAPSLSSAALLQTAGEIARLAKDKKGVLLVAQAYRDTTFGLADAKKAEEFTQLAANTRGWGEVILGIGIMAAGAAILNAATTATLNVRNGDDGSLDVMVNGDYKGFVSGNSFKSFNTSSCDSTVVLRAKGYSRSYGPKDVYLACGETLTWTLY